LVVVQAKNEIGEKNICVWIYGPIPGPEPAALPEGASGTGGGGGAGKPEGGVKGKAMESPNGDNLQVHHSLVIKMLIKQKNAPIFSPFPLFINHPGSTLCAGPNKSC